MQNSVLCRHQKHFKEKKTDTHTHNIKITRNTMHAFFILKFTLVELLQIVLKNLRKKNGLHR